MTPRTSSLNRLVLATLVATVCIAVVPVGVAVAAKHDVALATAGAQADAATTEPPTSSPPTTTVVEEPTTEPLPVAAPAVPVQVTTTTTIDVPPPTFPPVTAPPRTIAPVPVPVTVPAPVILPPPPALIALAGPGADPAPAEPPPGEEPPAEPTDDPLDQLNPSDRAFLLCVRNRESHGDYTVVNPTGTYRGAYQFSQSTWNNTAAHAGRTDLIGIPPNEASPHDQDEMAVHLLLWYGRSPWAGPGC